MDVKKRPWASLVLAVAVIFLDQATKAVVDRVLTRHEIVPVIPDFFYFGYVRNPGAAFGLLAGAPPAFRQVFFTAASLVAIGLILYYLLKAERDDLRTRPALSLILAGATGNLIDRVRYGAVIDFLEFHLWGYHWPNFNVADAAITVGAVLLCLGMFRKGDAASAPVDES